MNIQFFVPGVPIPKGSAKAFFNKKTGRAIVMQTNRDKQKPWASMISYSALQAIEFDKPSEKPIGISVDFYMPRPKSHYGSGKNAGILKANSPDCHVSKPDIDKTLRCVLDALTGIIFKDDSQVVSCIITKMYETGRGPGAMISIREV